MLAADYREAARKALAGRWGKVIVVTLIAVLLGASGMAFGLDPDWTYQISEHDIQALRESQIAQIARTLSVPLIIWGIVMFFVGAPVELGLNLYYIDLFWKKEPTVSLLFDRMPYLLKSLAMRIVTGVMIALWSLLFIIPGIVAAYRYAMATYILAQEPDIGILEAISRSKALMEGNKGRLFCLHISFIGWALLSALTLGIGALLLNPYRKAAETAFYLSLTGGTANPEG